MLKLPWNSFVTKLHLWLAYPSTCGYGKPMTLEECRESSKVAAQASDSIDDIQSSKQSTMPWSRGSRDNRRQSVGPLQSCTSSGVQWTSGRGGVCGGGGASFHDLEGPLEGVWEGDRRRRSPRQRGRLVVTPRRGIALLFFPSRGNGTPDSRTLHTGARPPSTARRSRRCGCIRGGVPRGRTGGEPTVRRDGGGGM